MVKSKIYFVLLLFFSVISSANGDSDSLKRINHIYKIVFITPSEKNSLSLDENNDLKSLRNSISVAGLRFNEISIDKINTGNISAFDIIILPFASAKELKPEGVKIIAGAVNSGVNLLFDGITKLNDAFAIHTLHKEIQISKIRDLQFPEDALYWTQPTTVNPIDNSLEKYNVLCVDDTTKLPIVVSGAFGKGKFIYFSTLFDPITDKGYSRFPYLIESLENVFGLKRIAELRRVEMYFDPGMRYLDTISIDSLAKQWRTLKIKRIFAAGWYYDGSYDYKRLLKVCHENGIQVYCWLETPMISEKFWNNHPAWREKTAYLKDAQIDWRFLMNLADEDCRKQIYLELNDFLIKNDWDGVDFAEMYFEPSPVGPELPENFTPMNDLVRKEFQKRSGFDPVSLFDAASQHYWKTNHSDWRKYADYRKELCYRIKSYFLDFLSSVKTQKKDFEIMLTVIDVSLTPEISDNIGEDTQNTLACYKKFDISLQIEDPSNCWGLTPERYNKLGQSYRPQVPEQNKLLFDCNVVASHEKGFGGFPSEKPSGEEIRQIAYNMDLHSIRPAFYSEDALYLRDFKNISTVLARNVSIDEKSNYQWNISTPNSALVNIGTGDVLVKMDNKNWFAVDGDYVIVPKGNHKLEFYPSIKDTKRVKLFNISGELNWAKFSDNTLELSYSEDYISCYISVDRKPEAIYIDSKKTDCDIYSCKNNYTIKFPNGKHSVKIVTTAN